MEEAVSSTCLMNYMPSEMRIPESEITFMYISYYHLYCDHCKLSLFSHTKTRFAYDEGEWSVSYYYHFIFTVIAHYTLFKVRCQLYNVTNLIPMKSS